MIELQPGPGRAAGIAQALLWPWTEPIWLKRNVCGFVQKTHLQFLTLEFLIPCCPVQTLPIWHHSLLTAEVKKPDPETGHQNKVFHVLILIFFTHCLLHTSKWWMTRCNWSSPISQKNATKGVTPVFVKQACHPKNPDMHSWEEVAQSALLAGVFTRLKGIGCLNEAWGLLKRNKQQVCISRGQSQICLYLMDMLRNTCKYINHLWRLYVQWVWTRNKIS